MASMDVQLETQVFLVVYLLMFVAARRLRRDQPDVERGYRAPALGFLCVVGLGTDKLKFDDVLKG